MRNARERRLAPIGIEQIEDALGLDLGGHRDFRKIQVRKAGANSRAAVTTPLTPAAMSSARS